MKHFSYLSREEKNRIFYKEPEAIGLTDDKEILARSLGATLYIPGIKPNISEIILEQKIKGLSSIVMCLEDSISDNLLADAEKSLTSEVRKINAGLKEGIITTDDLPFMFVRVRSTEHFRRVFELDLDILEHLSGLVFPKFSVANAKTYIEILEALNERVEKAFGRKLYFMPILETDDLINFETRRDSLVKIADILEPYKALVLNIRIGATDFSGLFGLRRNSDNTVYDISILRECIADIVNCFARIDRDYVVSGPVWEYFGHDERIMKPRLRATPFFNQYGEEGVMHRKQILNKYLDGLIYESSFDNINGLVGKTVIHPSHIIPVQSLLPVAYEDYIDAKNIYDSSKDNNGVFKSFSGNKMNEVKPHLFWARKTLMKSKIYGVLNEEIDFTSFLFSGE